MPVFMKTIFEMLKFIIVFIICTILFFYVIKAFHQEYEKLDRYHIPEGNAVKVVQQEGGDNDLWERLSIFFRLGE